jgi:hypothetical protein
MTTTSTLVKRYTEMVECFVGLVQYCKRETELSTVSVKCQLFTLSSTSGLHVVCCVGKSEDYNNNKTTL